MNKISLVCVDVDGTLVGSTGSVLPEVWTAIHKAREAGIRLALCSGRPGFGTALNYARQLDNAGWHIFQNGASIVHLSTGETRSAPLNLSAIEPLITRARQTGRVLELYTDTDYAVESTAERAKQHADLLGVPFRPRPFSALNGPIVRAEWLISHAELKAVLAEAHQNLTLSPSLSPAMPDTTFVNMTAKGVDKASALRTVAQIYGISLANVMAVGDGPNDVAIMRIAGFPIAMGNAAPEAIDAARLQVGTVDEGGLAEALELAVRA